MGTGIVFVVLVAIWVAYFVQYWSRRREHLATARSVEAFSEAMRVLERRPALRAPVDDRGPTAYAVSPSRVVRSRPAPRPQVMVKPRSAPASVGGDPGMRLPTSFPTPDLSRIKQAIPTGRVGTIRPSRKVRGLTLLAALAATLIATGLAVFTAAVQWWAPLAGLGLVIASFFWLRSAVQAEIKARRAARARRPRRRQPSSAQQAPAQPISHDQDEIAEPTVGREAELIESHTVLATDEPAESATADGWNPVPVPPPTYTLKAKAERPTPILAEDDIPESVDLTPAEGDPQAEQRAAYGT